MAQPCRPRAMSSSGLHRELTGVSKPQLPHLSNERTDEADEPPFRAISRTNEGTRSAPHAACCLLQGSCQGVKASPEVQRPPLQGRVVGVPSCIWP